MSWPKFGQNLKNTSGTLKWVSSLGTGSLYPPAIDKDGNVYVLKYVGTYDATLIVFGSIPKCKATKALRRRRISVVNPL